MNVTWHLIPMAAIISLVYSATRYELRERIIERSVRMFVTILVFMAAIYLLLVLLSPG